MSNLISTTAILSKRYLADQIQLRMDADLASRDVEVKGFDIKIQRQGPVKISAVAKSILVKLPLEIHLSKPEGIFTIEGQAALEIDARIDLDISSDWRIDTSTQLQDYTWLQEPSVTVGAVNIPLETIVDSAIHQKEEGITKQLDKVIAEQLDLQRMIALQTERLAKGIEVYDGLLITGVIQSVQISHLKEEGDYIYAHCLPSVDVLARPTELHSFTDVPQLPTLTWIFDRPVLGDHQQEILAEVSYDFLARQVLAVIDNTEIGGKELDVQRVDISYDQRLIIQLDVTTPVPAKVSLSGQPVFDQASGSIDLADIDVKVKPNNIIYKLSAPIINRIIESRLEALLPVGITEKVNDIWREQQGQLPQVTDVQYTIDIDRIEVAGMSFLANKVVASVIVKRPEIEGKLG